MISACLPASSIAFVTLFAMNLLLEVSVINPKEARHRRYRARILLAGGGSGMSAIWYTNEADITSSLAG